MLTLKRHFNGPGGIHELLVISIPIIISQAADGLMLFTDRYLLMNLGKEYPSASMAGGFTVHLWTVFFHGVLGYTTALVGQYLGAGQKEKCGVVVNQAFLLTLLITPFLMIGGRLFTPYYFDWAHMVNSEKLLAIDYFNALSWGIGLFLIKTIFSSFFSGIGQSRIVMISNITGMLINIPLSYFLIHGLGPIPSMGIQGAALGMMLSEVVMITILLLAYLNKKNRKEFALTWSFHFDRDIFAKLWRYGSPSGMEYFLIFFAFSNFVTIFHSYGTNEACAMTITFNWDILTFLPLWGLGTGVMSLVGQYMGAGRADLAHRVTASGAKVAYSLTLFFCAAFLLESRRMIAVFMPSDVVGDMEAIVKLGVPMLQTVGIYCLGTATNIIFASALRAAGDTRYCMYVSMIANWLMLGVTFLAVRYLGWAPLATWGVFVLMVCGECFFFVFRFGQGRWKMLRVVEV